MENEIIIVIIAALAVLGVVYARRHFRHESGCCGGGGTCRVKRKKLPRVLYQKTFQVQGMHCDHCRERVEEVINDIPGVAGTAELSTGTLAVSYAQDVPDDLLRQRLQRAGYPLA